MSVRRKFANLLEYFNPFSTTMPAPQDEDGPAAKKPRLEISTSISISTADDASDAEHDTFLDAQTYRYYMTDDDTALTALPGDTVAVAPADTVTAPASAVAPADIVTVPASLPSAGNFRARKPLHIWTPEEDAKLLEAVKKRGYKWVEVASLVPGRTHAQCRTRWRTKTTAQKKGKWTPEEDATLTEAVKKHTGNDWVIVAAMVPGRTNKQCNQRWIECVDPAINTGKWTMEEDAMLTHARKEHGGRNWVAVAALVPTRTSTQCRKRWIETLDPGINLGKWTLGEDAKLTEAVTELGDKNWNLVGKLVPGRTNSQCRKRWIETVNPELSIGKWTTEEDAMLNDGVMEHGVYNWIRVAVLVPGRTNLQCRQRWVESLDPGINRDKWRTEADAKLTGAIPPAISLAVTVGLSPGRICLIGKTTFPLLASTKKSSTFRPTFCAT
jgi:hypothetical protein